ncbi:alpha-L-fucosidase [Maribacter sp. 4U21]|uniref:alpha-L-fucosidase n=1 Tax=Maribacter sp. 4U21 TaxID=1889779 RepID=UPI000C14F600|nr:alpha-L-fucosidase [Maribacter sp. 4U21]PIB30417.1 alpha-L-fucosidase [Maribacter sp. 4U21]
MKKIIALLCLTTVLIVQSQKDNDMDKMWGRQNTLGIDAPASRTSLFDNGNYAMFIHWGIYSNIANKWKDSTYYGISEWIMHPRRAGIPPKEYMAEAKNFNPINFNARAIAQLAKDAGMKYIVITSKHHDGFAMYESKSNDFNIVKATPFARDPMKELAKACKDLDLGFGFYYSHNQDWTFPGGNGGPTTTEKGKEVGFDYYFKNKCLPQVKEIVTEYGDIDIVWFDTPGNMEKKYVEELVQVVRKYQPNAMISGRAGHNLGDYKSLGDMNIPIKNIGGLWESVDVTNDSWGYAWYDQNWKSPKRILTSVISTVARGGTYMLNVGPAPDGTIPMEAQRSLRTSGKWIIEHPQIIYKAKASPWGRKLPWGDATMTPEGKVNLCVYEWPLDGKLVLPGIKGDIIGASLLQNDKKIRLNTGKFGTWLTIDLPSQRPDRLVSVIEVVPDGTLDVATASTIDPYYPSEFPVDFATSEKTTITEKKWMEKFGEWKHIEQAGNWKADGKVTWEVEVKNPGYYKVDLNYAGEGRLVWNVSTEEGSMIQNEQNSSHIYNYYEMGLLRFERPGKHEVTVSLVDGNKESASLKEIRFTPEGSME